MNISNNEVQRCQLFDILFVPQLSYNLQSFSKATQLGKTFELAQSSCVYWIVRKEQSLLLQNPEIFVN